MNSDDKLCYRIHCGPFSSDSDSDGLEYFDETYYKNRPPPLDYEEIKDRIVVIPARKQTPRLNNLIKPDKDYSSVVKGTSKYPGDVCVENNTKANSCDQYVQNCKGQNILNTENHIQIEFMDDFPYDILVDSRSSVSLETQNNSRLTVKSKNEVSKGKVDQTEQVDVNINDTGTSSVGNLKEIVKPFRQENTGYESKESMDNQVNTKFDSVNNSTNKNETKEYVKIDPNSQIKKEDLLDVFKMVHDNRFIKEFCSVPKSCLPLDYLNSYPINWENSVRGNEKLLKLSKNRMTPAKECGSNGNNLLIKKKSSKRNKKHRISTLPTLCVFNINNYPNINCLVMNYLVIYQSLLMHRLLTKQIYTGDYYLTQKYEYSFNSYNNTVTCQVQFEIEELIISHRNIIEYTNQLKHTSYYTVLFFDIIASMSGGFYQYYNIRSPSALFRENIHKESTTNIVVSDQLFKLLSCLKGAPFIPKFDAIYFECLELQGNTFCKLYDTCKLEIGEQLNVGTESSYDYSNNQVNIEALGCTTLLQYNIGNDVTKYTENNNDKEKILECTESSEVCRMLETNDTLQNNYENENIPEYVDISGEHEEERNIPMQTTNSTLELVESFKESKEKHILESHNFIYCNSNIVQEISREPVETAMLELNVLQNYNEFGRNTESVKTVETVLTEIFNILTNNTIAKLNKIIVCNEQKEVISEAHLFQNNKSEHIRELVKSWFENEKINSMLQNSESIPKFVVSLDEIEEQSILKICYIPQNKDNSKYMEEYSEEAKEVNMTLETDNMLQHIKNEESTLASIEATEETDEKYIILDTDNLRNIYDNENITTGFVQTFEESDKNNVVLDNMYFPSNRENILEFSEISRETDSILETDNNKECNLKSVDSFFRSELIPMAEMISIICLLFILFTNFLHLISSYLNDNLLYILAVIVIVVINLLNG